MVCFYAINNRVVRPTVAYSRPVMAATVATLCIDAQWRLLQRPDLCTPGRGLQISLNLTLLASWCDQKGLIDGTACIEPWLRSTVLTCAVGVLTCCASLVFFSG